jgi:hypothetical protein
MLSPRYRYVLFIIIAASIYLNAQPTEFFLPVEPQSGEENKPLEIRIELNRAGTVQEMFLLYRPYESNEYRQVEMRIVANNATGLIPAADVRPPFVEYYIVLRTRDGEEHTYPALEPEYNPLLAQIRSPEILGSSVVILSPQNNEQLRFEELVISASLYDLPQNIRKELTAVYVGDRNITEYTIITDEILIAIPSNIGEFRLPAGRHRIRLELFEEDNAGPHVVSWYFTIPGDRIAAIPDWEFRYNISMTGESRNESLAGGSAWYNRSTVNFVGDIEWIRIRSNLHLTNEERNTRQPQNRYSLSAETPWVRLHAGDTYPRFPSLIMNGRRLRGFFGQVELGYVNLDYATGQTIRSVEGRELYRFPADSIDDFPPPNSKLINDSTYAVFSYGSHTRTLTAIRPSFGSKDFVQMGFTYLHSKDDVGSIEFGNRPAENLVVGSDLSISLDKRRIQLSGEFAGSIQNNDISRGNLTREELEDLIGTSAVDRLEDFVSLSTLQKYITINQYLVPFDPRSMSSVALDLNMRLNYFGNYLQVGYIRRGNDFSSFGLTSLRRDVAGIRMRDRLRLMQNQLYIDLSIERLRDNLHDTKANTTYFDRYDASISYFPRRDLPSVTVGYGYFKNDNRLNTGNPGAIRDATNRMFTQVSYDFEYIVRHNGTLSFNMSFRDDQTPSNADVDVYNVVALVNSRFDTLPLRTNVGLGLYQSRIPARIDQETGVFEQEGFNYFSLIFGGEYRLFSDDLTLSLSFMPTFGDYNRSVFQAGAQYYFMRNLSVVFRADYMVNPDTRDDIISNLVLRYDI